MRKLVFVAITVLLASIGVFGQTANIPDPTQKPHKQTKEKGKPFEAWINEDVPYIITDEERKAFEQLKTDEERENFIATFWDRRDPDPDTEENEFKEEYYERLAYANEHYTSGIPGWKTDRGRIYIKFGKPDSIESHPSGGAYNRPSYEGGGSTTVYPFETWFYRHLDRVGDGIEIEFVDPTGTGEYRIARNADEKDALAMVPGAGLKTNELLGLATKADRSINSQASYMRDQDSLFRRMEILKDMSAAPNIKYTDITGVDSPVIDNDGLNFDVRIDYFRQSDERVIVAFTVQTENKELSFSDRGGLQVASMNINARISTVFGKRSGAFEDVVSTTASAAELAESRERKSVYQKAYVMTPGTYKVAVTVRDINGGKGGIRDIGFKVPKYVPEKLSSSSLVLASRLYETTDREIGQQFVIGDKKVVPNLSRAFKKGREVGVYLQIYNVGIDQTTLRPDADVEYILLKDGKEINKQLEDWQGLSDSGRRLTLARLIQTTGLAVGEYELKVRIKDRVNDQVIEPSDKFSIVD